MKAICFVGKAGSGKDTAASAVMKAIGGLQTFKWADTLKDVVCLVYGWDRARIDFDNDYKEEVPRKANGTFQCPGVYGDGLSRRQVLQLIGTDAFRNLIADDTWLEAAMRRIEEITEFAAGDLNRDEDIRGWVNTDTRYPNEAQFIRDNFDSALVVLMVRDGDGGTLTSATTHTSETSIDDIMPDFVIHARSGELNYIRETAIDIATRFFND